MRGNAWVAQLVEAGGLRPFSYWFESNVKQHGSLAQRLERRSVKSEVVGSNPPGSFMNSKTIGERSEAIVLSRCLQLGYVVLIPFGDNQRYDFVIDKDNGFKKVQVKTARLKGGSIQFNCCSSQAHRGKGHRGYKGECDYFIAYCPQNQGIYLLNVDDCPDRTVTLRENPSKNNQQKGIRYSADYIF